MYEEYLDFAKSVALEAGGIMLKYFSGDNGKSYKSDRSVVTRADTEINSMLIDRVRKAFPGHRVDGEEEQYGEGNMVWVCDPLDGTAVYTRHMPMSVFSLALVEDGRPVAGVIYDPFTDSMYSASLEGGAFRNGEAIRVNDLSLDDSRGASNYDMWSGAPYDIYEILTELRDTTYFLSIGSVIRASAAVSEGNLVMTVFPGTRHKNCDIAAAKVIVEEAGGKVTDIFGNEQRYDLGDINGAIVSNGKVHGEIVALTRRLFGYRDKQ
ncbi:MAG: inositol monophosphatase [Oscillospiraceae bacterium]|nr:inositol monophosphatase [Oscillospiraceae bacterium]